MPITAPAPSPTDPAGDSSAPPLGVTQPLDVALLARIAVGLRAYQPLDLDLIFEDVDAVVGEHASNTVLTEPAARLSAALRHLVTIVVSNPIGRVPATLTSAVEAARALLRDDQGAGPSQHGSVSWQRRIALAVQRLVDLMTESRMIAGGR